MFTTENFYNDLFLQPVDQQYLEEASNERKQDTFEVDDLNSTTENDLESSSTNINSSSSFSPLFFLKHDDLEIKSKSPSIQSFLKVPLTPKKNQSNYKTKTSRFFRLEDRRSNPLKITDKLNNKGDFNVKVTKLYFTEFLKMKLLTECTESTSYEQQLVAILSMCFKL
jgi:hypothetical protein